MVERRCEHPPATASSTAATDLFGAAWRRCGVARRRSPPRWASPSRRCCTGSPARTSWCRPCWCRPRPIWCWRSMPRCVRRRDDPLDRIDAVVRAVFRPAVRRPALLGLIREVSRLSPNVGERRSTGQLRPLVDRASCVPADRDGCRSPAPGRPRPGRRALLRHGHRHRHRAGGAAGGRLAAHDRRVCAACATSCWRSCGPPWRPDQTPRSAVSRRDRVMAGQTLT